MAEECTHLHGETYWYLDGTNEKGWACITCRMERQYRPDLDRALCETKVWSILQDLAMHDVVYVSNSEMGEHIIRGVVAQCRAANRYDQRSITAFLLAHPDLDNHAYWQERAQTWQPEQKGAPPEGQMALGLEAR